MTMIVGIQQVAEVFTLSFSQIDVRLHTSSQRKKV